VEHIDLMIIEHGFMREVVD